MQTLTPLTFSLLSFPRAHTVLDENKANGNNAFSKTYGNFYHKVVNHHFLTAEKNICGR